LTGTIAAAWKASERVVLKGSWTSFRGDLFFSESDTLYGVCGFSARHLLQQLLLRSDEGSERGGRALFARVVWG